MWIREQARPQAQRVNRSTRRRSSRRRRNSGTRVHNHITLTSARRNNNQAHQLAASRVGRVNRATEERINSSISGLAVQGAAVGESRVVPVEEVVGDEEGGADALDWERWDERLKNVRSLRRDEAGFSNELAVQDEEAESRGAAIWGAWRSNEVAERRDGLALVHDALAALADELVGADLDLDNDGVWIGCDV